MTHAEIRRLARIGAERRLREIQLEIEAIHRAFPDLRPGNVTSAPRLTQAVPKHRRRKRTMSAAAKKAVSLAQKKRWAAWRKKNGKAAA
jgi:hypothetical protein